jgi:hypothetical protein
MIPAGSRITAAIKKALAEGYVVASTGRPLTEWVAQEALGRAGIAITEGERRGLDEQIDRWWRRMR